MVVCPLIFVFVRDFQSAGHRMLANDFPPGWQHQFSGLAMNNVTVFCFLQLPVLTVMYSPIDDLYLPCNLSFSVGS